MARAWAGRRALRVFMAVREVALARKMTSMYRIVTQRIVNCWELILKY